MKRIASFCSASVLFSGCSWCVTRTAATTSSSGSSRLEKRTAESARCTRNGGNHEKTLRFFPLAEEPVRQAAQETGDDSTRQRNARLLQEARGRSQDSLPDTHQHVSARLCCAAEGAAPRMAAVELVMVLDCTDLHLAKAKVAEPDAPLFPSPTCQSSQSTRGYTRPRATRRGRAERIARRSLRPPGPVRLMSAQRQSGLSRQVLVQALGEPLEPLPALLRSNSGAVVFDVSAHLAKGYADSAADEVVDDEQRHDAPIDGVPQRLKDDAHRLRRLELVGVCFQARRWDAVGNELHDGHRAHPLRREHGVDDFESPALLALAARVDDLDDAENEAGDDGGGRGDVGDGSHIHFSLHRRGSARARRKQRTAASSLRKASTENLVPQVS